jgi:ectoine hydroxylase-related dioxygenase (phytanoyl-CoA dioxygenase family)
MSAVRAGDFLHNPQVRRQALEEYRAAGYFILEDVFDEASVAHMRQTWEEISDRRRGQRKSPHASLLMIHNTNPAIVGIVRNRTLVGCVEGFLGGKVKLIQSQLMHAGPGSGGFSPRQDNYYNRADPRDGIIAAWIAVDDVDQSNGALSVIAGSHLNGLAKTRRDWLYLLSRSPDIAKSLLRLALPKRGKQENDTGVIERFTYAEVPKDSMPIAAVMKAGSVLFMHGDTIHFSGPNHTNDRLRRSLLTNFVRTGTAFAKGRLSARVSFDVYAQ